MSRKTQLFAVLGAVMLIVSMAAPVAAAPATVQEDVDEDDSDDLEDADDEGDEDDNQDDAEDEEEDEDAEEEEEEEDAEEEEEETEGAESATNDNLTLTVTNAPSVELLDDGEPANGTVTVSVTDENASYAGAGEYSVDEDGTVELPAPNETVSVTVTGAVDNRSVSLSTTLGTDAADNFGLEVAEFVGTLQDENVSGPMGQQVANFVLENNPAADKIPDHAGPPEDKGPDGERGPPEDKGPSDDKGPSEDTSQGPPEDKGPGGDAADDGDTEEDDGDTADDGDATKA
jgi:hypothetical protein